MTVVNINGRLHKSYSLYSNDPRLSIQHVVSRCDRADHTVSHLPRKLSAAGQDGICFAHHCLSRSINSNLREAQERARITSRWLNPGSSWQLIWLSSQAPAVPASHAVYLESQKPIRVLRSHL